MYRAGRRVAELRPLTRPGLAADALLERRRHLPSVDPVAMRRAIDEFAAPSLTAIANDLPIYTCNPGDFDGIEDLQVVALPVPLTP